MQKNYHIDKSIYSTPSIFQTRHGSTRSFWANFYAEKFNKTRCEQTLQLAVWYLILFEAFGDEG